MRTLKILIAGLTTAFMISVATAQPTINEKSAAVQKIFTSQIGVREATGHNDGPAVEGYLKAVNLGKGYAWCAAFVKWSYLKAGVADAAQINAMAASVHRPGHIIYQFGNFLQEPLAGDAFTLYYPGLKRIGHTGFYDKRLNSTIYATVEGNTNSAGSREGDGVYRKYRSFKSTHSINRWF